MDANPVLVEQTRGNWVENRHRGALVVSDASGRVIASAGDISRPVFPRSAIKSMQALAMVTSGSIDKFALTDEELALACASHHGEDVHVTGVTQFLEPRRACGPPISNAAPTSPATPPPAKRCAAPASRRPRSTTTAPASTPACCPSPGRSACPPRTTSTATTRCR